MRNISGSESYGLSYITAALMSLPFNLSTPLIKMGMSKLTMQFSGVPGPTDGYNWGGMKVEKISGFIPEFMGIQNTIFCFPVGNNIHLSLWTSRKNIKEPERLIRIINKNI